MLGKWIIRSALMGPRRHKDVRPVDYVICASLLAIEWLIVRLLGLNMQNFVYNNDEIYLEQDWFYLGADSDAGVAVLRQLPPSSSLKDVKDGEYLIERRAAWRIRLLDSTNGGSGLSLAQQQMERLLFRAKMQLKQSKKMRAGQTKSYAPDLNGGAGFTSQLRSKITVSTRECDERHMGRQDRRLDRLAGHLASKAETMNRNLVADDDDIEFPTDFNSQQTAEDVMMSEGMQTVLVGGTLKPAIAKPESPVKTHHGQNAATNNANETTTSSFESNVCALCQSSTIGYNLCSQIHSVMHAIKSESELEMATNRLNSQGSALKSSSGSANNSTTKSSRSSQNNSSISDSSGAHAGAEANSSASKGDGEAVSRVSALVRTNSIGDSGSTGGLNGGSSSPVLLTSRRKSRMRDATGVLVSSQNQNQLTQQQTQERERILKLFSVQDTHILDIIKFKERTAREVIVAEEHARMGLSPVATHFRDRFKHVGLLAQSHMAANANEQHGIGGHFQKLHAELFSNNSQYPSGGGRKPYSHVEQLAQELGQVTFTFDERTCPIEYPGEGFDVFGHPIDQEAPDPVQRTRLFPSEHEMELIAPIDTKVVMDMYSQNRAAVGEMLDGFVELCETQMVPNLHRAMETYNRGSLVEILDFTARASEFVCARRIQIQVAKLIHEIAESDVGDFAAFEATFDAVMKEFDATTAFIRFYREKGSNAKKKRK